MSNIENFDKKLKEAQKRNAPDEDKDLEIDNRGMRAGSEFLAAVIGFGVMGFAVDRYFGTAPLGMMGLIILGFVAGVYTANKTMREEE